MIGTSRVRGLAKSHVGKCRSMVVAIIIFICWVRDGEAHGGAMCSVNYVRGEVVTTVQFDQLK